jgi:hypothetical protein
VFVRIRGSVFSRDPEKALEPLWRRIEELGGVDAVPPPVPEQTQMVEVPQSDKAPMPETSAVERVDSGEPEPPAEPPVQRDASAAEPEPFVQARSDTGTVASEPAIVLRTPISPGPGAAPPPATALEETDEDEPSTRWVQVPEGYRSVAWVRPHEAEAVLQAYANREDVPIREHHKLIGWARYHADDSEKTRIFRANVMLERSSAGGARFVCWLRESEAKALLQAVAQQAGVPIGEHGRGWIGHVEYYPPQSEEARRFRSPTRLLRVRGGGHS